MASQLFTRVWRPEVAAPRAVVVISHGFNAHSGHYGWFAEQLVQSGFAVYALDHRGRGHSDLLGHSAGGVIACVYALEHQAELRGTIC